jgi:hypothetical protein
MMALPHAVITTPVIMPLNTRISSSLIIEGTPPIKVQRRLALKYSLGGATPAPGGICKIPVDRTYTSRRRASVTFIKIMRIFE